MTQNLAQTLNPRRWKALGVIALVQFMLVLDITVVNVALPHIQSDLHFSRAGLAWVVDGYVLTAGGLLLLGGRLGDLLGRRRLFIGGVLLFAAASAASGAAVNPAMLVASRFVQGMGEAIAAPAAFGLVALLFTEPKERAKAIGIFGGVAGLGGTLGPVISGLLISVASWRWIFFVNIPIGIVAAVVTLRLVSESRADRVVSRRPRPTRLRGSHPRHRRAGRHRLRVHRCRQPPLGLDPGGGLAGRRRHRAGGLRGPGAVSPGSPGSQRFPVQPDEGERQRGQPVLRQRLLHRLLSAYPVPPAGGALLDHRNRFGLPALRRGHRLGDRGVQRGRSPGSG